MTEFKISPGLTGEVEALKSSSVKLANAAIDTDTGDIRTLKTSMRYVQQQRNIRNLLRVYQTLLLKDSIDLVKMITDVKKVDDKISSATK